MHVLIIGGTRFVGALVTWRLLHGGHQVTLLNRGTLADPFGDRVERLRLDRTSPDFARALAGRRFDAAIDFAAYTGEDAQGAIAALGGGRVGHYIFISTGQVYLVRQPRPTGAAVESDYDGPVMPLPADAREHGQWEYGMGKRACEDILHQAWVHDGFPATRLRIPMVNGERDYERRVEGYLWRLMDGGPILVPDGGTRPMRHVYGGEVARALVSMLGNADTFGQAYNLAQQETPTLVELLHLLAGMLGVTGAQSTRALELVAVDGAVLEAAGLERTAVSPFSVHWMSFIDPTRIRTELGFEHEPLGSYLGKIVAAFLAHTPAEPPARYARRAEELALARTLPRGMPGPG